MMEDGPSPIDATLRDLTGRSSPRICLIATASGDLPIEIDKFYSVYKNLGCEPSHLSFFRRPRDNSLPLLNFASRLYEHDAIFVGGGNTKSALSVWRDWNLDSVLREANSRGVLLAGMSAGAMCWFDMGLTDSFGSTEYRPVPCLGILAGGCVVHYDNDPLRRTALHASLQSCLMPNSVAIDDLAAVYYEDLAPRRVLSWRLGASARQVAFENGSVSERALLVQHTSI
ncbi:peptidase E [Paraburkholderia caledonica]|uniref:Peptidase E n=2 Tax=Paraburkholderia caledonica TaxID=134536 RepID=A0AB73INA0_9BURK|nr:peptidase E [Paraburkholderia caledonica]